MRAVLLAPVILLALAACQPKGAGKPTVEEARVRLAAVEGRPAAAYFTLKGGKADDRLVRIDSAVVDRIELHEGAMKDGMMTMRPLKDAALPAGGTVAFAPGGNHAMLYGVDAKITPGTAIPLLFTFGSGATVEVEAKSVAPGDDVGGGDMGGMHH